MKYCISTDHFTEYYILSAWCLYHENNNFFLIVPDLLILFQTETENDNNIFPIAASEYQTNDIDNRFDATKPKYTKSMGIYTEFENHPGRLNGIKEVGRISKDEFERKVLQKRLIGKFP